MVEFFQNLITWGSGTETIYESIGAAITSVISVIFAAFYLYQFFYLFLSLIVRPRKYKETDQTKRYGVVIAARNEELVLPELLKSIAAQTYPQEQIRVFVVADNCTDNTAAVARSLGATVYERFDQTRVGKGFALEYLFYRIAEAEGGFAGCDAYIVLDADNVLRANYIEEMDKAYCAGNKVLTSYRNSKNYGSSWVSAGYALWFMHESRHLNNARSILRTSAAVSGTGFLVDRTIIERNGGWKHFLLTEDIEFTADCILHGDRVGYCDRAELFDEQPVTFRQSWRQRKRWAKGFFQVFRNYGGSLLKGSFKFYWACYDMTMNIMPAFFLSTIQILSCLTLFVLNLIFFHKASFTLLKGFLDFFLFGYAILFVFGLFALITEWRKIHCKKWKAVLYLFTFPVFMITYLPISLSALCSHVEWKPIEHKYAMTTEEIEKGDVKEKNQEAEQPQKEPPEPEEEQEKQEQK